ncbi:MAG: hypothetical protein WC553_00815 [Patescibacteria group bacterium]
MIKLNLGLEVQPMPVILWCLDDFSGLRAKEILQECGIEFRHIIPVEGFCPSGGCDDGYEPRLELDDGRIVHGVSAIKGYAQNHLASKPRQ